MPSVNVSVDVHPIIIFAAVAESGVSNSLFTDSATPVEKENASASIVRGFVTIERLEIFPVNPVQLKYLEKDLG